MSSTTERPPRRTQAARRAQTRAALIAATMRSLAGRGHAGTSTAVVREAAGVTTGALHHHFRTKADLLAATYVELVHRRRENLQRSLDNQDLDLVSLAYALVEDASTPEFDAVVEIVRTAEREEDLAAALLAARREVEPLHLEEIRGSLPGRDELTEALLRVTAYAAVGFGIQRRTVGEARRQQLLDDLATLAAASSSSSRDPAPGPAGR